METIVTTGTPKSSDEIELLLNAVLTAKKQNRPSNVIFLIIVCLVNVRVTQL